MTRLAVGQPLATREPRIDIDAGLAAGTHRFQLEVLDDAGLRSRPDVASVVVQPTVIVRPPLPQPNPGGPLVDPVGPVAGPPVPIVRPGGPVGPIAQPVLRVSPQADPTTPQATTSAARRGSRAPKGRP